MYATAIKKKLFFPVVFIFNESCASRRYAALVREQNYQDAFILQQFTNLLQSTIFFIYYHSIGISTSIHLQLLKLFMKRNKSTILYLKKFTHSRIELTTTPYDFRHQKQQFDVFIIAKTSTSQRSLYSRVKLHPRLIHPAN